MWLRSRPLTLFMVIALVSACTGKPAQADASTQEQSHPQQSVEEAMKIRIVASDRTLTVALEDSETMRDFVALLPLDLVLSDYNGTEKIADLPRHLLTDSAPEGVDPAAGDIAYYAPWGNLAIFYRDFGYSRGLVRLGRLEGSIDALATLEGLVRIEPIP